MYSNIKTVGGDQGDIGKDRLAEEVHAVSRGLSDREKADLMREIARYPEHLDESSKKAFKERQRLAHMKQRAELDSTLSCMGLAGKPVKCVPDFMLALYRRQEGNRIYYPYRRSCPPPPPLPQVSINSLYVI
jgi:hypothetical protein